MVANIKPEFIQPNYRHATKDLGNGRKLTNIANHKGDIASSIYTRTAKLPTTSRNS